MIAEQLQAARAAHWRQNQSPILTLDDAKSWMSQHPLCLYLPRHGQLPAPAPSFVEACVGKAQGAPSLSSIEPAHALLTRLVGSGTVVALNLFGAVGEQPDFLAHSDALPFVLSLRADADWKHAPQKSSGHKVSPLVLELWKVLEKEGQMTADQARETLGRELTEAAVLRALCELWQGLRILPVFGEPGQPARWEMVRMRHREALATAGSTSQVTAISLLVSMYLQSVYAASSEEIEIFLSPVASRARVREAVRGLSATRQIHSLSMDAQTYYFLENGLPAFAEPAPDKTEPLTAAPGAAAQTPMPAVRPVRRKMQATTPVPPATPIYLPASLPAESEPIFRRPKPTLPPETRPAAAPGSAERAGWKSPGRPAPQPRTFAASRPPRPASDRPGAARGPQRTNQSEGTSRRPPFPPARSFSLGDQKRPAASGGRPARPSVRPGTDRPERRAPSGPPRSGPPSFGSTRSGPARSDARSGSRPFARPAGARPDARGGSRPFARPAGIRPDARPGTRPDARPGSRTGARPDARPASRPGARPSAWAGAGKREESKPWALPGRKSSTPVRPPRPGGRGPAAGRPPQKRYDRPGAPGAASGPGKGPVREGGAPFRPRAPRGDRGPGDPSRARSSRIPSKPEGRRPASFRSNPSGPRPTGSNAGEPPRSARPSSPRPPRFAASDRPSRPRTEPGDAAGRPPSRPSGDATRRAPRSGGARFDRPRTGGYGQSGVKSGSGQSDQKGRPPRAPGTGPAKPGAARAWSRAGKAARKPGKPSPGSRGPKPDRKKPGA